MKAGRQAGNQAGRQTFACFGDRLTPLVSFADWLMVLVIVWDRIVHANFIVHFNLGIIPTIRLLRPLIINGSLAAAPVRSKHLNDLRVVVRASAASVRCGFVD